MDNIGLKVGNDYVIYYEETELMDMHVKLIIEANPNIKHILDIGYGIGLFASAALEKNIESYTVVESHPKIIRICANEFDVSEDCALIDKRIIRGNWQESLNQLGSYDAIMYDPCSPPGYSNLDLRFFIQEVCARHLTSDGIFSFWNSGPSISDERMIALRSYFSKVTEKPYTMKKRPPHWKKETISFIIPIAIK